MLMRLLQLSRQHVFQRGVLLYSKNKLELNSKKSNSSDAKKMCLFISFLHIKPNFRYSSLHFARLSKGRITDKLATNWQNFVQVGLQLKLGFRIRPVDLTTDGPCPSLLGLSHFLFELKL